MTHELSFNLSPGLTYEAANGNKPNLSAHFESTYYFAFDHFHIGQAAEIAYDQEDYHKSLGLHIGYGF
jgi:hypothetical protein